MGEMAYGAWYSMGCSRFSTQRRSAAILAKRKSNFEKERDKHRKAQRDFEKLKAGFDERDRRHLDIQKRWLAQKRRFEKAKRAYRQESFENAAIFTNLGIGFEEAMQLASAITGLVSAVLLVLLMLVAAFLDFSVLLYLLPAMLIGPIAAYALVMSYPEMLSKRMLAMSIGRTPEAVNFLVMSMRLTPSLNSAMAFAAENAEEPIRSSMKKLLWDIYMHRYASIEEAFTAYAYHWGAWNEDFKRALYAIRSAATESDRASSSIILDKANSIIITGTKMKIEVFASSLSGPTTILFSFGVLMPMIIGAALPILAINLPTMGSMETAEAIPTPPPTLKIILLMDVVFPLMAWLYAYRILGSRPGTSSPPKVDTEGSRGSAAPMAMAFAAVILLPSLLNWGRWNPLPLILALGVGAGIYLLKSSSSSKKERDRIMAIEAELPDALFQIGSLIGGGEPLELSLKKASEGMKGTPISRLLADISYSIQLTRAPLEQILFGERGCLTHFPSRSVKATMRTVVELVKKDAVTAGQSIMNISTYLREMRKFEHDIKVQLGSVVSMMKATAMVFAPLVMGITSALYVLLSSSFSQMSTSTQMIPQNTFFLIIGIYLLLTVAVIMYFTTGIEHGDDRVQLRYNIGVGLPVASAVYVLVTWVGMAGFA
jgi:Flp pilus assembly protein TadB